MPIADIHGIPPGAASMEGAALAVRRFDRTPDGPVHMEDFAQVFGIFPDDKYKYRSYANLAAVLWAETGEECTYEFIRRTAVLSPAYDFVATFPYITGAQVRRFIDTAGLPASPVRDIVQETMDRTEQAWKGLEQKDVLPDEMEKAVGEHIHTVLKNSRGSFR